jgi:hypothetical protein
MFPNVDPTVSVYRAIGTQKHRVQQRKDGREGGDSERERENDHDRVGWLPCEEACAVANVLQQAFHVAPFPRLATTKIAVVELDAFTGKKELHSAQTG